MQNPFEQPLRSGLPSEEKLVIELLKIRAAVLGSGNTRLEVQENEGVSAAKWAQAAVRTLSLHHSITWRSPFGDIEFSSKDLETLNWLKDKLEKYADSTEQ